MFLKINKRIRYISLSIILLFSTLNYNAQVAIGPENDLQPYPTTDLTLTAKNKGFLPNIVNLNAISDPTPLTSAIKEGTIVFNENVTTELSKGLYVWSAGKWNMLLMDAGPRQDYRNLVYKESTGVVTMPPKTQTPITELDTEFTAPKDGSVYISTLLYVYAQPLSGAPNTYATVGNTYFTINITDTTTGMVTTFYSGCSPLITYNTTTRQLVGNYPTIAPSISQMAVTEGHTYTVRIMGIEGWNPYANTSVGTFDNNNYSTVKVDFVSILYN